MEIDLNQTPRPDDTWLWVDSGLDANFAAWDIFNSDSALSVCSRHTHKLRNKQVLLERLQHNTISYHSERHSSFYLRQRSTAPPTLIQIGSFVGFQKRPKHKASPAKQSHPSKTRKFQVMACSFNRFQYTIPTKIYIWQKSFTHKQGWKSNFLLLF